MMQTFFSELDDDIDIPSILVVGCGRIGESLVRALIDHAPHREVNIYVTDSDKERARKLSEYRVSQVTPIKWRYAHDTPEDVDVIVVCVDHDSEHKVIDRLALAKKPFVSLSDDASVYDSYEVYENDFRNSGVHGIVGTGLIPGAANVLVNHCALYFDRVFDITVERLGFVSSSSLASVKRARRETSISVRDGYLDDSRRNAGNALSWFPSPFDLTECQSVAVGVKALYRRYPDARNISVRYSEPKLPTFSERVRNLFLHIPLTTTLACIRVEVHGIKDGEICTRTESLQGDAMNIITQTTLMSILGLHNTRELEQGSPFHSCDEVVSTTELFNSLYRDGVKIARFDGSEN